MPSQTRHARSVVVLAFFSAALFGCAGDQQIKVWTKSNVSAEQRDKDYSACRRYADKQMAGQRGVQQDVDVMNGGTVSGIKPNLGQNLGAYNDAKRYDGLVDQCMTEAGYTAVQ